MPHNNRANKENQKKAEDKASAALYGYDHDVYHAKKILKHLQKKYPGRKSVVDTCRGDTCK